MEGNIVLDLQVSTMTTTTEATIHSDRGDISWVGARPQLRARLRLSDPNPALRLVRRVANFSMHATDPTCVSARASHIAPLLPSGLPATAKTCILHLPRPWATELPALLASTLDISNIISGDLLENVTSVLIAGPRRTIALNAVQLPIMCELNHDGVEQFVIAWACGRFVHVIEYELDETFCGELQAACSCGGENYRPYTHYSDEELEAARVAAAANPPYNSGFAAAQMLVYRGPDENPRAG